MSTENALGLALLCVCLFYIAFIGWFCSYLKKAHPEVWRSLGEPSLLNYSIRNSSRVNTFIWRNYKDLNDRQLRTYIFAYWFFALTLLILFSLRLIVPSVG
jgi:hypothetical protein